MLFLGLKQRVGDGENGGDGGMRYGERLDMKVN